MTLSPQRWVLASGLLLLALLTLDAARHAIADLMAMEGRYQSEAWERSPGDSALWSQAFTNLHTALRFDPTNPSVMEDLGHLYDQRAVRAGSGAVVQSFTHESLAYFRAAAQRRPVSPYVWSNIAVVKFHSGELDQEFSNALQRAVTLGPWEPIIQLTVADIGLGAWDKLGPATRKAVVEQIQRAAHTDRPGLEARINQARREQVVCALSEIRVVLPGIHCA